MQAITDRSSAYTLLMCLGRVVYANAQAKEFLDTLAPDLALYIGSAVDKVQGAASELKQLLDTPAS